MSPTKLLRRLRLFPAVLIVGGGLLVLKGAGLVHDAQAQSAITGQVAALAPHPTTDVTVADASVDDADSSSAAEVGVLTSLSKRRNALDARSQSLDMQANLIAAAEKRVDDKIASLKALQAQIQVLLGQRDAADQTQLNSLVKTYSSMKPKDAARIFNNLDETVQLNVAAAMKPDVLGAILANMQSENAQQLTLRLANRLKVPNPAPVSPSADANAAPAQTASLEPAVLPAGLAPTTPLATPTASAAPAPAPTIPAPVPTPVPEKPQPVVAKHVPAKPQPKAEPKQQTAALPPAQQITPVTPTINANAMTALIKTPVSMTPNPPSVTPAPASTTPTAAHPPAVPAPATTAPVKAQTAAATPVAAPTAAPATAPATKSSATNGGGG